MGAGVDEGEVEDAEGDMREKMVWREREPTRARPYMYPK